MIRAAVLVLLALAAACGARAQRATVPRPPAPQRCVQVCHLSDAICHSRDDICRVAADLPSDTWARDRCDAARASCDDAARRCTSCDAVTSRR